MRLWMVDPKMMCRAHLLGEHQEVHMAAGCIAKGWESSLKGLARTGKMEVHNILNRHIVLEDEMHARGMSTPTPFPDVAGKLWTEGHISVHESICTLYIRCTSCRFQIGWEVFAAARVLLTKEERERICFDEMARRLEGKVEADLSILELEYALT